jgi:hypothetical protein
LKPVTYVLAALYFLVDAAFMAIAKPISDWLARHVVLRRLRAWIRSLRPYPSLALFSVPVIILEPIKPVAAYLAATCACRKSNPTYWWCSPPRTGRQRMVPASLTARETGASFSKDKCVLISL